MRRLARRLLRLVPPDWEVRTAPVVVPVLIPLMLAAIVFMAAVGAVLIFAHAALSPMLPRSWRFNWDTAFDLNPSLDAKCPECRVALTLGAVDKRGHVLGTDRQGREIVAPAQAATCTQCGRAVRRVSHGKIWSGWETVAAQRPLG